MSNLRKYFHIHFMCNHRVAWVWQLDALQHPSTLHRIVASWSNFQNFHVIRSTWTLPFCQSKARATKKTKRVFRIIKSPTKISAFAEVVNRKDDWIASNSPVPFHFWSIADSGHSFRRTHLHPWLDTFPRHLESWEEGEEGYHYHLAVFVSSLLNAVKSWSFRLLLRITSWLWKTWGRRLLWWRADDKEPPGWTII